MTDRPAAAERFTIGPAGDPAAWNAFVERSRNGTFLFRREYMTYHADRFTDCSLTIRDERGIAALLPANRDGDTIISHAGLTYGGLVLDRRATVERVVAMVAALARWLRGQGVRSLVYKTVPAIYHREPAEEDRYALFVAGAQLVRRDVLTVVSPHAAWQPNTNRTRSWARARRAAELVVGPSHDWLGFWPILQRRLRERYDVGPAHEASEMILLAGRFPATIRLLVATLAGEIAAGVVLYESACVVHVQYMATTAAARELGLLDTVLRAALEDARAKAKWFDFGSSTDRDGRDLNGGLASYKESFGGRTAVHDVYRLELG